MNALTLNFINSSIDPFSTTAKIANLIGRDAKVLYLLEPIAICLFFPWID